MKNYIFDFDGTLVDSGQTAVLATQAAFNDFGLPVPSKKTIDYFMGIPIEKSFKSMSSNYLFSNQEFEKLLSCFRDHYKKFELENSTLFPEIKNVLLRLHRENKVLFIVSSKHSTALLRNLKQLGINQYFADIIGSDHVNCFKPNPEGITKLVHRFKLEKETSIMIGDSIFDLQMGKNARVKIAGVTWGAHLACQLLQENPDYLFKKPTDLLKI